MSSILRAAQRELKRHSMGHFVDNSPSIAQGGSGVVVSGCEACGKVIYTRNGFVEHLANDVLPRILETAFSMATKFVYCRDCKAVVEYEKSVLEAEGRTGLEIVCARCHSVICTFHDSKPTEAVESKPEKPPSSTGGSCVTARNRGLGTRLFVSHVATSVATFGPYPTHQIDATMASLSLLVVRPPIWSLVASALLHLQVARRWKPALRRGIANPRRCESTCKRN